MRKDSGLFSGALLFAAAVAITGAAFGAQPASAAEGNGLTPRLDLVIRVVEGRAWAPLVMDGAICLPDFARARLEGWLDPAEAATLPQEIARRAPAVLRLRQLLAACPDPEQRTALRRLSLNSVIGLDVRPDGMTVLFTR